MGNSFQRFFEDLLIKRKSFYLSQYMMCKMLNNLSDGKLDGWFIRDDGIWTIDLAVVLSSPCEYCLKRKQSVEKYCLYIFLTIVLNGKSSAQKKSSHIVAFKKLKLIYVYLN